MKFKQGDIVIWSNSLYFFISYKTNDVDSYNAITLHDQYLYNYELDNNILCFNITDDKLYTDIFQGVSDT